jgi:hypothetical protein
MGSYQDIRLFSIIRLLQLSDENLPLYFDIIKQNFICALFDGEHFMHGIIPCSDHHCDVPKLIVCCVYYMLDNIQF